MFINFDGLDNEVYTIEIQLGNQIINRVQLPTMFAQGEMHNIIRQLANDSRPMKVSCSYTDYSESGKALINSLTFMNNSFANNFGNGG